MRHWAFAVVIAIVAGVVGMRSAAAAELRVKNLRILVVIYRGAPDAADRLSDADVEGMWAGVELGRLFYFRNTSGRLNLDITRMVVDTSAPNNDDANYDHIVADLTGRGVQDNQYDGLFVTGVGFTGNWGGYQVFGKTGAAMGMPDRRGGLTWWPDVWYGLAWTFVHEFQHALDGPICGEQLPQMLSGHPYSDSMEPYFTWGHKGAQHFSWQACLLREFGARVLDIQGACQDWLEVTDTDSDGLADADARLPMDEVRLGSDPALADTDGDGLNDLGEFTADIYRGADPRNTDTDADGLLDGQDPAPTVAIAARMPYAAADPVLDGVADAQYGPLFLRSYAASDAAPPETTVQACWHEEGLFLLARTPKPADLLLEVDSSPENGYWEGGDTYLIRANRDGKVLFAGLGLEGEVPGAKVAWGADGLEVAIPAVIGQGVSNEINWGGKRRAADRTDGLHLAAGQQLGVNAALEADGWRVLFTPSFELIPTTLAKSPTDPPRPSLRYTARLTRETVPTAVVSGVRPADEVAIVGEAGTVVGRRVGDGPVLLTGPIRRGTDAASGSNRLLARVGTLESAPVTVVVDTAAEPPAATRAGGTLRLSGEPGATVEVLAGREGFPMQALGTVTLDAQGRGEFALPDTTAGFLGAYAEGTDFGPPLFYRVDPTIAFEYEDRTCDPRLPADGFCIIWTGFLHVPANGDYTFCVSTDDGSRLYVDGALLVDHWGHHGKEERSATTTLNAGEHAVELRYYEDYGWAAAHLEWSGPGIARTHELPVTALPFDLAQAQWFGRQTDAAGNQSAVAGF